MTLEKAEKLPNSVFEKLSDSETVLQPSPPEQSQDSATVLDIGVKAENSPFLGNSDGATVRQPPINPGQPATGQMWAPGGAGTSAKLGDSLSGKTATKIFDFIFPAIIAYVVQALGYRFDKRMVELTPEEEKVIASAMQDYLNTVQVSFNNPLYTLLFVIGGVYTGKAIEILPNLQKTDKAHKNTAQSSTASGARVANLTVVESLISKTVRKRKKGRGDAIKFLLGQGEIIEVSKGVYKLA